jgi:hypothetical protein
MILMRAIDNLNLQTHSLRCLTDTLLEGVILVPGFHVANHLRLKGRQRILNLLTLSRRTATASSHRRKSIGSFNVKHFFSLLEDSV